MRITIYKTKTCPRCKIVEKWLNDNKNSLPAFRLDEMFIDDPEQLTEARMNGVFLKEAPGLMVGRTLLTAFMLFKITGFDSEFLRKTIETEAA